MVNLNHAEGSGRGLLEALFRNVSRRIEQSHEACVRISSGPAGNRIHHFPNRSLEMRHCANLLVKLSSFAFATNNIYKTKT
jgi:hypothetical protein